MEKKIKIKYLRKWVTVKNHFLTQRITNYFIHLYQSTIETNTQLKSQFFQFLPFLVASSICGIIAFLYYRLFRYSEKLSIYIYEQNHLFIFIITPVCFLCSWYLVTRFAPYSRGSGIPQVMASLEVSKQNSHHLIQRFLSLKIIVIKVLSSAISVIGGGILGREGPTIQISSSIFVFIYNKLPSWWPPVSKKNIIIAGAASGLAAAFNTPLGGIIFAIEELSKFHIKYYKSPLFIAVIIAGLSAQGLGGSYLYLGYPKIAAQGWLVIVGVLAVSLIAGYFGSKMCVILLRVMGFFNRVKSVPKQVGLVLFCALFVATFIYFMGVDAMGSGKELMERTLFTDDKTVEWYIPFVRMNGLIATFSFGGAGGIFAPSLSSGASIGAVVAEFLHLTGGNANLLILVGMTAFLTGVTRAPFTSTIIVFEMTDRHSVIFFLMLSGILANMVGNFVDKHPFYDQLKRKYIKEVTL